jgi:hypothetical protein
MQIFGITFLSFLFIQTFVNYLSSVMILLRSVFM